LVGGGRVFGPRPRSYNFKLNKKVKQLARKSALASKLADQQIMVVENFNFEAPKTKEFVSVLNNLNLGDKKVLYVVAAPQKNVALSLRNLPACRMAVAADLNTYSILNNNMLLLSEDSVEVVNNI
ncbi:MAG: 50S ribosomal protein L4, partial [Muribaculaceae bacterium]|nr:50S ribosomal protein L4 [Muribaculaceae bacterium]